MKYCENCGAKLQDNASFCLECGKKVETKAVSKKETKTEVVETKKTTKKGLPVWAIILIVFFGLLVVGGVVFTIVGAAVFKTIDSGILPPITNNGGQTSVTGTIGDTLSGKNLKINLTAAKYYTSIAYNDYYSNTPDEGKIYMVYFVEVENTSNEDVYFSSYNWNAYADGYAVEDAYIMGDIEGNSEAYGTIAPGMKLKGYIAFEIPSNFDEFQATYVEDEYSSSTSKLTFKVTKD